LALAALPLVVFGAYDTYPKKIAVSANALIDLPGGC